MSARDDIDDGAAIDAPLRARSTSRGPASVTVAQLHEFDEIIDVRSEDEYAEDHVPGAVSCPVLSNDERARVGTLYKQVSSFEAKKTGAALVSANIARHLEARFQRRPREWRPLVYCWRGGSRSGALAQVMHQVGWRVAQLEGGYRAYRRKVLCDLSSWPARFDWRAVCGLTGSGKSRLLRALQACGGQVLDLEALAVHRGSVLGNVPDAPQPSQKMFESLVWDSLRTFSQQKPVYVEAESKKIGALRVPDALINAMWSSSCLVLDAPIALRVELLKMEYEHYIAAPATLIEKLQCLSRLYGHSTIEKWSALVNGGRWDELTQDLLLTHYDPAYTRSTLKHYSRLGQALRLQLTAADDTAFSRLAQECLVLEAGKA